MRSRKACERRCERVVIAWRYYLVDLASPCLSQLFSPRSFREFEQYIAIDILRLAGVTLGKNSIFYGCCATIPVWTVAAFTLFVSRSPQRTGPFGLHDSLKDSPTCHHNSFVNSRVLSLKIPYLTVHIDVVSTTALGHTNTYVMVLSCPSELPGARYRWCRYYRIPGASTAMPVSHMPSGRPLRFAM